MTILSRILVTGHLGYIGSHLTELLDNYIGIDIKDGKDLTKISDIEGEIDCVVHLASHIQVRESLENPLKYIGENVLMTLNAIEIAKKHNARFIFTSTASNGNAYATSKKISEHLIEISGLSYSILRLSNVAGGIENHDPETHFIPTLFNKIKSGKQFIVNGTGETIRDYVHVEDVCSAILKEAHGNDIGIYEIGTGVGYAINHVIKKVLWLLRDKPPYCDFSVYYGEAKEEPDCLIAENPKYECEYNLDDILNDYANNILA